MTESFHHPCGVDRALAVIGSKWTLLILHQLIDGPRRFGSLEQSLPGISTRTLTQRLEELVGAGIVERDCSQGHPVYQVTPQGASLQGIIQQLRQWGDDYAGNRRPLTLAE